MLKKTLALLLAAGALAAAGGASAGPGLVVGFSDDSLKYEPAAAAAVAGDLGAKAFRVTLLWERGQTDLTATDVQDFDRMVAGGGGLRVFVALYGRTGADFPADEASREQFCSFARSVLDRYPQVNDLVLWNETNKQFFAKPQFSADGTSAAPAAYGQLAARCWDVVHAARPAANLICFATSPRGNDRPDAVSNVSHSPGAFIRKVGDWYRSSGRTVRLCDSFAHHAYGESSSEPVTKEHAGSTTIGLGDWRTLMQAYHDAFAKTGQPLPGAGPSIYYLETGFQTAGGSGAYTGAETDPGALSEEAHAQQILAGVRLAYCQPFVAGYFNLQLWDEADRGRWQSGALWLDRSPKGSYGAFKQAAAEAAAGTVDCAAVGAPSTFTPQKGVGVQAVRWPVAKGFHPRNSQWRFRIKPEEDVTYAASIVRAGRATAAVRPAAATLKVRGTLKQGYLSFVKFPARRLKAGSYQMRITLTSAASSTRSTTLTGPRFSVGKTKRK